MAFEFIIAGGGIAGLSAGLTAAGLGRTTLVLTGDVLGGNLVGIDSIEGYPGYPDGVAGYELCPAIQEQAAAAGAEIAMTEVTGIEADGDGWRVQTTAGAHQARAVILATGTALREIEVPGAARLWGRGVSHCASCDAPLLRGQPVAVVGGGDSALQEALTLAAAASRVTVLVRGAALTAAAVFRARAEAHPGIELRFNTAVEEILGDHVVSGVRIGDAASGGAEDLAVAGVFVYIGMRPNTAYLDAATALDATGRVTVDAAMRTARPGLLAAGTVRAGAAGRAAAAAGDGVTAAIAAAGYLADGTWCEG